MKDPKQLEKVFSLLRHCIIYIYAPAPVKGEEPTFMQFPKGTGFLLAFMVAGSMETKLWGEGIYYIITNKHMLHEREKNEGRVVWLEKILIRFNHPSESRYVFKEIDLIRSGVNQNTYLHSDEEVDLAAIRLDTYSEFLPIGFAYDMLAAQNEFEEKVRLGSHIMTIGYLPGYAGMNENQPALRFGRVALLSDELWWKSDRASLTVGLRENAYIVEINAIGGCSGSPVTLDVSLEDGTDPVLVGVLKGAVDSEQKENQGLAAVEKSNRLLSFADSLYELEKSRHPKLQIIGRDQMKPS